MDGKPMDDATGQISSPIVNVPRQDGYIRQMCITQWHLKKFGRTDGCPGCRGGGEHNEECRGGIIDAMKDDAMGRERLEREKQRYDRHLDR